MLANSLVRDLYTHQPTTCPCFQAPLRSVGPETAGGTPSQPVHHDEVGKDAEVTREQLHQQSHLIQAHPKDDAMTKKAQSVRREYTFRLSFA